MEEKKFFERFEKKNIKYFRNTNKYENEWYNLQSIVKKYTKTHETNGWDIIFFCYGNNKKCK